MSGPGRPFHTLDKDLGRITHVETAQLYAFRPVWRLGLAVLALVALLILAIGLTGRDAGAVGFGAGLVVAGWLGLAIGSNDVANSLGPAVGAGAIGLLPGLVLVALAQIAGASLAGGAVTDRLASGIFDPGMLESGLRAQMAMLAALIGAACWITLATGIGLPVSTSHSIVGGLAGAGIAALGASSLDWPSLAMIALVWIIAPVVSGALAAAVLILLRIKVMVAADRVAAAQIWLPPLVGVMSGLFVTYLGLLASIATTGMLLAGLIAGLLADRLMRRHLRSAFVLRGEKPSSKRLFRPPLLAAVVPLAFAHGANDVGNVAGPLTVIVTARGGEAGGQVSLVAILLAAFAIAVGTLFFGRRLVRMVGSGITRLNAGRAFCVSLSTAATVLAASWAGLPVSTTHIAVGGIFGVGFAREWLDRRQRRQREVMPAEEARRRRLIRRSHVATITTAWLVTVPLTALMGWLACVLILAATPG
ncbi:MAG: inorganic phosphate transporter [Paracoccus sp. (in: a-proteobacteria)]|uniref:inorganic phosphate transporter n=1 Tax=unclassified Paracoccus (in: a-proteobacteria) TaxID=2688777 RepID=UPI000C4CCCB8|nr:MULTISPECIES: inorganic phosphate transporter [unclassified Paracoccus (in: a-proteobacteria)]MBA49152.1 inorganic phosphate transporter [Paracoccus sp. (in: a-proteobacteria)]MDB2490284.1 inorganic phosphate transporter [Paracoccus sp. (in: a-proteobacteria)]MDB2552210.1 inorganic phosphate transporter [Paracoccus sp. (in: a-proteobacteria)]HIC66228.1 inorganic phosphate transporter [Paracoccus sp. (in: a-proteobacteria)]